MEHNTKVLYAELFPLGTPEADVRSLFTIFGKVRQVTMPTFPAEHPLNKGYAKPRTKGYAFIEYHDKSDAERACAFFNDLNNNILVSDGPLERDCKKQKLDHDENYQAQILNDPKFVALMPLRVMSKSHYSTLAKRYEEQRFQSLMRAAKALAIV